MTPNRGFGQVPLLLLLLLAAAGCARQDVSPAGGQEVDARVVQVRATPVPAPAAHANSLDRALRNWVLQYPAKGGSQWVFAERAKKGAKHAIDIDKSAETHTVEIGKPCHLKDVTEFDAQVTANGKWGVQFEYQGQVKKFNLAE